MAGVEVRANVALAEYTRFGLGGAARWLVESWNKDAFLEAMAIAHASSEPSVVLGGGTNLIVADQGFPGIVLRYRASGITKSNGSVSVEAGADLQALVDFAIEQGLAGLHTMTRIPGWVGAALYGNAGAYGHSINEFVTRVEYAEGSHVRLLSNRECQFAYRESIFKKCKGWIILAAELTMPEGPPEDLRRRAAEIQSIRDAKYPPTMRCAGSIFKNCLLAQLPASAASVLPEKIIIEDKVPSAWFLEQVGAKGMRRGDIQVAHYHANLLYNDGVGTSADVHALIDELKHRVMDSFGFELEEEVQYVGFPDRDV